MIHTNFTLHCKAAIDNKPSELSLEVCEIDEAVLSVYENDGDNGTVKLTYPELQALGRAINSALLSMECGSDE